MKKFCRFLAVFSLVLTLAGSILCKAAHPQQEQKGNPARSETAIADLVKTAQEFTAALYGPESDAWKRFAAKEVLANAELSKMFFFGIREKGTMRKFTAEEVRIIEDLPKENPFFKYLNPGAWQEGLCVLHVRAFDCGGGGKPPTLIDEILVDLRERGIKAGPAEQFLFVAHPVMLTDYDEERYPDIMLSLWYRESGVWKLYAFISGLIY